MEGCCLISITKLLHAVELPILLVAIFKYNSLNFDKRLSSTSICGLRLHQLDYRQRIVAAGGHSYEKYGFAQSYRSWAAGVLFTFISIFVALPANLRRSAGVATYRYLNQKEKMMTYTISRAEQVLQTQRQALNLRWYPHDHLAARAGWINDPNGLVCSTAGTMPFINITVPTQWGPMHWGTCAVRICALGALPVALAPEGQDKDAAFPPGGGRWRYPGADLHRA